MCAGNAYVGVDSTIREVQDKDDRYVADTQAFNEWSAEVDGVLEID